METIATPAEDAILKAGVPLPELVFIGCDGRATTFNACEHTAHIHALAQRLLEHSQPGQSVGLLYKTGPELVLAWLASLEAGLEPLILQYPTSKQSQPYWLESVKHTFALADIKVVLTEGPGWDILEEANVVVLTQSHLVLNGDGTAASYALPRYFAIIQLSSGTTGYRKAIRFSSAQLLRHVHDYNTVLQLGPADTIVSWLPLYHDMGYIACFVMPLVLGIRCVMMDPMTWIETPQRLFDAIHDYSGTVCYMPNFGFEVMARQSPYEMPSMRCWVSCSEPILPGTIKKFRAGPAMAGANVYACYAMAENVFAVTFGELLAESSRDGRPVASCGVPLPGVELKIVADEIWVRSPTSLKTYLDGRDLRDEEGFYPTGDLGFMDGGTLFVSGRKQDLLVQAGRKAMLSDIDAIVNDVCADARGRAATIAMTDSRLGTEVPVVLIESDIFFERQDGEHIARLVQEASGLETLTVTFVPPRFLTKTSSGKFNRRKIAEHWAMTLEGRTRLLSTPPKQSERLAQIFGHVPTDRPVGEVLDSLSLTVLRIELGDAGITIDPDLSLEQIFAAEAETQEVRADAPADSLRIVSLADRFTLAKLTDQHLARLEESLGRSVTLDHVCLPPSPIILSDLIFQEYLAPRIDQASMQAASASLRKLREASIIITDDMSELCFAYESVYAVLSHNVRRDAAADLISTRWQSYVRQHHLLPLTVVGGVDLPLEAASENLRRLEAYCGVPVFRVANIPGFAAFTEGWEHRPLSAGARAGIDPVDFIDRVADWLHSPRRSWRPRPRRPGPGLNWNDLPHFCSCAVSQRAIDILVDHYDSFCIFGQDSSVPYLRAAIEKCGKAYVLLPSYADEVLGNLAGDYACYVSCGAFGDIRTDKPFVALQHVGQPWRLLNAESLAARLGPLNVMPESGLDWYRPFRSTRLKDYNVWSRAREGLAA